MVIDDFHVRRTLRGPANAHTKLIVDADAVLLLPISLQGLKAIAWRGAQELQCFRRIQLRELAGRDVKGQIVAVESGVSA